MPDSVCARQSPSRFAAMPRPVVAVNFAFWADCFRNPPVFVVTAPLPKKFSDTFWEPCLSAFPYLIRYGLRDVCLSRRPRAAARLCRRLVSKTSTRLALTPVYLPYINRIFGVNGYFRVKTLLFTAIRRCLWGSPFKARKCRYNARLFAGR